MHFEFSKNYILNKNTILWTAVLSWRAQFINKNKFNSYAHIKDNFHPINKSHRLITTIWWLENAQKRGFHAPTLNYKIRSVSTFNAQFFHQSNIEFITKCEMLLLQTPKKDQHARGTFANVTFLKLLLWNIFHDKLIVFCI